MTVEACCGVQASARFAKIWKSLGIQGNARIWSSTTKNILMFSMAIYERLQIFVTPKVG